MALVIKKWYANTKPNTEGNYVEILARESGLIAWLLSLMKIDPTFFLQVSFTQVTFQSSNFQGFKKTVLPINHVSSSFYGYHKPWIKALFVSGFFLFIATAIGNSSSVAALITMLIGIAITVFYYLFNKELLVGFSDDGANNYSLILKRSMIENPEIKEVQMGVVVDIILTLIGEHNTPTK